MKKIGVTIKKKSLAKIGLGTFWHSGDQESVLHLLDVILLKTPWVGQIHPRRMGKPEQAPRMFSLGSKKVKLFLAGPIVPQVSLE